MRSRLLILLLCLFFGGCSSFRPGFVESHGDDLGGHFEGEEWVPDDPTIAWTYNIPDISAGFIYDARFEKVTPSIQLELLEFDTPLPWPFYTWKVDAGVAYQRAFGYLGPRITSIFEISVGVVAGWNFEERDWFIGPSIIIIKF